MTVGDKVKANKGQRKPKKEIPQEYGGISEETADRIAERLDKCFSEEDYRKFKTHVEEISMEAIVSENGMKKVKEFAVEAIKQHTMEKWFEKRTFWVPLIVSIVGVLLSIAGSYFVVKSTPPPIVYVTAAATATTTAHALEQ